MRKIRFWQLTLERAVKTFAQSLLALLSAGGLTLLNVPWTAALSTAGMAAVLSVLMSVASAPVGEHDTPSLLPDLTPGAPPTNASSIPASSISAPSVR